MNKFLKLAVIPVAFLITGATTNCSAPSKEIALITDIGDIDDGSFNQESWEAVKDFAIENHKSYDFYRPFNDSDFARNCAVKQAVAKGAQVIVLPGFKFAPTCANAMEKYPDVKFLLIDSYVHNGNYAAITPTKNICCVGFKCEYSGFIAGYTIAKDLLTRDYIDSGDAKTILDKYGFGYVGGMASSGVYEFGFGYIQGICRATADFCNDNNITKKPDILINYSYAGVFAQDDPTAIKVKSWYSSDGVKVVFPCGGKLYQSVTEAAQYYNKHNLNNYEDWLNGKLERSPRDAARWVGVDSDQYRGLTYDYELKSIYTSALKGLNPTIINALSFHYNGKWDRIGGLHGDSEGNVSGGGKVGYGGQWILGLNSVFGEYSSETESEPFRDNYVGIPEEYDQESKIFRGFDNFVYNDGSKDHKTDYIGLYDKLITNQIKVTGDDGSTWKWDNGVIASGYPNGMNEWYQTKEDGTKKKFLDEYLGSYDGNITISVK